MVAVKVRLSNRRFELGTEWSDSF